MDIAVTTHKCIGCGQTSTFVVDERRFLAWQNRTMLVQDAFPDMPLDIRETLISGTHDGCWMDIFGSEDDA